APTEGGPRPRVPANLQKAPTSYKDGPYHPLDLTADGEFDPQVVHNDLFQILGLFGILRPQRVNDDLGLALCQPRNLGFYNGEDEVGDRPGAPLGDVWASLIAFPHLLPLANPAPDFCLGPEGL